MDISLAEHRAIYAAVVSQQSVLAAQLLQSHIAGSRRRLHQVLDAANLRRKN